MISKTYRLVGVFLATLCLYAPPTLAQSPVFIELFTSKFCPACPPSDRALSTLTEQNPGIITLSCHVTYFDRGKRKDVFSAPFCDARQSIYKLALRTGGIFTPMAIVNGRMMTKGKTVSDYKNAYRSGASLIDQPVGIKQNGQYLDIALPRIPLSQNADVWLFEYIKEPQLGGYTGYRNVVTNITKLMRWNGKPTNMAFPINPGFGKGFAIVVQDYKTGVIAAAKTP